MISMQVDRLRRHADLYDGTTKPELAKELQRPHLAQELRDAADTIWQLRDDLQRANAENAKLRELVRHLYEYRQSYFKTGIYPTDHGVTERRMRELRIEVDG